ncbi:MAG TPA: MgtC/SapB family protein [Bacteroidia bacterium]|jgi:putative Mg2+ transporter-C (MgtC) family protein|nr:MgtC/SapB family protein [Bacteroidia bacterium]
MNTITEDLIKLVLALIFGAIIGTEREYKTKSAGFRTVILIMVGATLFTIVSGISGKNTDPTRIASNIVTGIGFIGAGAIFKEGNFVKGLTTAAVIWISAAIGMSIGIGQYEFAFLSLCIVMSVLLGFSWFQNIIDKSNVSKVYKITLLGHTAEKQNELDSLFSKYKLSSKCINRGKRTSEMYLTYSVRGPEKNHDSLMQEFYSNGLIDSFEC